MIGVSYTPAQHRLHLEPVFLDNLLLLNYKKKFPHSLVISNSILLILDFHFWLFLVVVVLFSKLLIVLLFFILFSYILTAAHILKLEQYRED